MKETWDAENAYEINQGTKLAAYQDHKKVYNNGACSLWILKFQITFLFLLVLHFL